MQYDKKGRFLSEYIPPDVDMLQYRIGKESIVFGIEWSEWGDVPMVVSEDKE